MKLKKPNLHLHSGAFALPFVKINKQTSKPVFQSSFPTSLMRGFFHWNIWFKSLLVAGYWQFLCSQNAGKAVLILGLGNYHEPSQNSSCVYNHSLLLDILWCIRKWMLFIWAFLKLTVRLLCKWKVGSKPVHFKQRCVTDESHKSQERLIPLAVLISATHTI